MPENENLTGRDKWKKFLEKSRHRESVKAKIEESAQIEQSVEKSIEPEAPELEVKPIGVEDSGEKQPSDETLVEPADQKKASDTGVEDLEKIAQEIKERREQESRKLDMDFGGEIVYTRKGKEHGGKAYPIGVRNGFLSRDPEERKRAISGLINKLEISEEIRDKVRTMFDISNQKESMADEDGFLKLLGDENNRRFLVVYKRKDETEAQPHLKGVTAYNVGVYVKAVDEVDLTTPYIDRKAFWDLVDDISIDKALELVRGKKDVDRETFDGLVGRMIEEVGVRKAIQKVLENPGMLGERKRKVGRRIKKGYEGKRTGYDTRFEMKRFLWDQDGGLNINEDYFDDNDKEGVWKISINPMSKADDTELLSRAREGAIDRIIHKYKVNRLCTFRTTGGRGAAPMREYMTPDIDKFKEKLDELKEKLDELKEKPGGLEGLVERGALPIAEALGYMHGLGITHRDIKPGNIFVGKDGYAHISDFSISKTEEKRSDVTVGKAIGSPMYMSPAQAWAQNTNERDDIYSFGRTLTALILKEAPYDENSSADYVINAVRNMVKPFGIDDQKNKQVSYEDLEVSKFAPINWMRRHRRRKLVRNKQVLYEDLEVSKFAPFNWLRRHRRKKLVRRLKKILARCSQMGTEEEDYGRDKIYNSCQEVYEDLESALRRKEPQHVKRFLKETRMSEEELIKGAYELSGTQMSEEAKTTKKKTHKFYKKYIIPAVIAGSVLAWEGGKFGCKVIKDAWNQVQTYENGPVNK